MNNLFMKIWKSIRLHYYFYGLAIMAITIIILVKNNQGSSILDVINVFCYGMSCLFFMDSYVHLKAYKKNPLDNPLSRFLVLLSLGITIMIFPSLCSMSVSTSFII